MMGGALGTTQRQDTGHWAGNRGSTGLNTQTFPDGATSRGRPRSRGGEAGVPEPGPGHPVYAQRSLASTGAGTWQW